MIKIKTVGDEKDYTLGNDVSFVFVDEEGREVDLSSIFQKATIHIDRDEFLWAEVEIDMKDFDFSGIDLYDKKTKKQIIGITLKLVDGEEIIAL